MPPAIADDVREAVARGARERASGEADKRRSQEGEKRRSQEGEKRRSHEGDKRRSNEAEKRWSSEAYLLNGVYGNAAFVNGDGKRSSERRFELLAAKRDDGLFAETPEREEETTAVKPAANGDASKALVHGRENEKAMVDGRAAHGTDGTALSALPTSPSRPHRTSSPAALPDSSLAPSPPLVGKLQHRNTLEVPKVTPSRGSRETTRGAEEAIPSDRLLPPPATPTRRRASLSLVRKVTRTGHSDLHLEETLPDDDADRWAEMIRQKRASKRRRKDDDDDDRVLMGTKVDQNHVNYVTAYNMLTGIRFTVSRTNAKLDRDLEPADFEAKHKFSFDITGNELTPSAKYDFKFKDYAPWVFRHLRSQFRLDPADYLMSLTSKYILSELGSPGKSGSFFYFSRDYKYIIKTIHHSEHKVLRKILREYYQHVKDNPNTLLSQFYGLHRVKIPYGRKIHFVVMNNLFPPHRDIHNTFDLKGSTLGRDFREHDLEHNPRATLKDLNWRRRGMHIELGPGNRHVFIDQMKRDVALLERLHIMDYSLLIGIHDLARGNEDKLRDKTLRVFQPGVDNGPDEQPATAVHPASAASNGPSAAVPAAFVGHGGHGGASTSAAATAVAITANGMLSPTQPGTAAATAAATAPLTMTTTTATVLAAASSQSSHLMRTPSKLESQRKAKELRETLIKEKPVPMGATAGLSMPEEMDEDEQRRGLFFYGDNGGLRATHEDDTPGEVIYYLGIIDCLTHYGVIKRLEHFWKGLNHQKNNISAVPPDRYSQRFVDFISSTTMSKELVAAAIAAETATAAAAAVTAASATPEHHHLLPHHHHQQQQAASAEAPPPPSRPAPLRPAHAAAAAADPGVPERTLGTVLVSDDDDDDGSDDDERRAEPAASPAGAGSGGASFALPVVEEMAEGASQSASTADDGPEPEREEQRPRRTTEVNGLGHGDGGTARETERERGPELDNKVPVAVNGSAFDARVDGIMK